MPPNESFNRWVSFDWRYGVCDRPLADRAITTCHAAAAAAAAAAGEDASLIHGAPQQGGEDALGGKEELEHRHRVGAEAVAAAAALPHR